jgi:D-3-phosphoglycerate dehydrogenase
VSLVGKTLAVMGFGKVGSEVARRAKGLGMTVIAYDPYAPAERAKALGVELVSFEDACGRGDFFSLLMPLTPSTDKLFNEATFAKMMKGARIINVARGGVIDDDALVRALDSKQVAAAALDVFEEEPPAKDNPLVKRPDVICTPHLGASTVEAQEGVAVEIAEAVIGALNGELAATAVNAPMVPAEMLSALAPFIGLAEKLGRIALQLVDASSGLSEVVLTYKGSNKEELDTRLLRANVIKGLVQRDTTASVNLVNADTLAKSRGIKFVEVIEPAAVSGGSELLTSMSVTVRGCRPVMQAAADSTGSATVEGLVRGGLPWLSRVGSYNLSLAVEGKGLLLYANTDQPGIIGRVGTLLAKENVNIAFMAVARSGPRGAYALCISQHACALLTALSILRFARARPGRPRRRRPATRLGCGGACARACHHRGCVHRVLELVRAMGTHRSQTRNPRSSAPCASWMLLTRLTRTRMM